MITSRTPFRVSFFGGGTDYPVWFRRNPGAVLSTSIDKYCYITCRYLPPFFEYSSRIVYSKIELVKTPDEIQHPVVREALKYLGIRDGVEIRHGADLPARTGLGSSSTFAVGLIHALHAMQNRMSSKNQLSTEAIHIEQNILRENVGCQDQVISAHGGLNRIDFHSDDSFTVSPVILPPARVREFNDHLLLFFTGFTRLASDIAGEQIENTGRKENELMRMYDMVGKGIDMLVSGAVESFGEMLHEAWTLKRTLSSKVSTPAIDEVYNEARAAGAIGGKLLGAGGGGFMLLFARPADHAAIRQRLSKFLCVPFSFETSGSQIIVYQPDAMGDILQHSNIQNA